MEPFFVLMGLEQLICILQLVFLMNTALAFKILLRPHLLCEILCVSLRSIRTVVTPSGRERNCAMSESVSGASQRNESSWE